MNRSSKVSITILYYIQIYDWWFNEYPTIKRLSGQISEGSFYGFMQTSCGKDFGPPIYFLKSNLKKIKYMNRFFYFESLYFELLLFLFVDNN